MSGAELVTFARGIRKFWSSRGIRRELDDVEQEAALLALETQRRYGVRLKDGQRYYRKIAICRTGVVIGRARSPATLGERAAAGVDRSNRPLPEGTLPTRASLLELERVAADDSPDARLLAADRRWAERELVRRVKLAVARLSAEEKEQVAAIMAGGTGRIREFRKRQLRPELIALRRSMVTGEDVVVDEKEAA